MKIRNYLIFKIIAFHKKPKDELIKSIRVLKETLDRTNKDLERENLVPKFENDFIEFNDNGCEYLPYLYMPHLVASENARNPSLKLQYNANFPEFIDDVVKCLSTIGPHHSRHICGFSTDKQPHKHFGYIDIYKDEDGKLSIILIDSSNIRNNSETSSALFQTILELEKHVPELKIGVLDTGMQKLPRGCEIFALSFALKGQDYEEYILELHKSNIKNREVQSFNKKKHKVPDFLDDYDHDIVEDLLPEKFFKHAQHADYAKKLTKRRPDLKTIHVNKKNQTLEERQSTYSVSKNNNLHSLNKKKTIRTSLSIEHKKIIFLNRAIKYLENQLGVK